MSDLVTIPHPVKFLCGGTSGMLATCVVQPLDLAKTRMQCIRQEKYSAIWNDDGSKNSRFVQKIAEHKSMLSYFQI